jgi:uracil-DNA glycosylase
MKTLTIDPSSLVLLLQQTRNLLACHQQLGLSHYPALPELNTFALHSFSPVQRREQPQPVPQEVPQLCREDFQTGLAHCNRCGSADSSPRSGQGSQNPRIVVIGDVFCGPKLIWGEEEDTLFWRMMAAIQLDQASIYVTNAIKCPGQKSKQAEQHCGIWLHQELELLKPKFICTLGEEAIRVLLKTTTPFVRLRGRFQSYRYSQGQNALVLPTLHPRFLLQQPDPVIQHKIKLGVWRDLQLLQAKMKS